MSIQYSHYLPAEETRHHLRELHTQAQEDRLARLALGPRPLRRRAGRWLIAAGHTLAGSPPEAAPAGNG